MHLPKKGAQFIVEASTSHLHTGVSGEVDVGKSRENLTIHLDPKVACVVVLNQPTSIFVDGLTSERYIESIEQTQDGETLIGAEIFGVPPGGAHGCNLRAS